MGPVTDIRPPEIVIAPHESAVPRPIVPTVDSPPLIRMPAAIACDSESPLRGNVIALAVSVPPVTRTKLLRKFDGRIRSNVAVPALTMIPVPVPEVQVTLPAVLNVPPVIRNCWEVEIATADGVNEPPTPTCTI